VDLFLVLGASHLQRQLHALCHLTTFFLGSLQLLLSLV